MKPQRLLLGVFILSAAFLIVWLTRPPLSPRVTATPSPALRESTPSPVPVDPALAPAPSPGATAIPPAKPLVPSPRPPVPPPPLVPEVPVVPVADAPPTPEMLRTDLDEIQFALRDFRTGLGGNPVGSNAEITKALLGDNLKQIKIAVPPGSRLNATGEMCDRLGTPYFFHQVSANRMEIRSAGADRQMWTADDVEK